MEKISLSEFKALTRFGRSDHGRAYCLYQYLDLKGK
jgi:hypothetical protein